MPKFFIKNSQVVDDLILIDGEDAKHISKVLRYKIDDEIIATDEDMMNYNCKIKKIENNNIECSIVDRYINDNEPKIKVCLFQALPKSTKMESIIMQNIEVGITEICPFVSKYTTAKISDNINKKIARWQKIAESSSKQSQRGIIPKINEPLSFKEAIKKAKDFDINVVAYENEENLTLASLPKDINTIGLFIGSEGGFSEDEIELMKENDFYIVTLGKRILRTETAGVSALSILMHEYDR